MHGSGPPLQCPRKAGGRGLGKGDALRSCFLGGACLSDVCQPPIHCDFVYLPYLTKRRITHHLPPHDTPDNRTSFFRLKTISTRGKRLGFRRKRGERIGGQRWYVKRGIEEKGILLILIGGGALQLPLGLLNAAQGHPMLVELKNGETLNGHLVLCDTWMNLTLREVVQTSPVGFAL